MIDFYSFDLSIDFGTGYMMGIVVDVLQSGIGNEIVVLEIGCGIVFGLGSEIAICGDPKDHATTELLARLRSEGTA